MNSPSERPHFAHATRPGSSSAIRRPQPGQDQEPPTRKGSGAERGILARSTKHSVRRRSRLLDNPISPCSQVSSPFDCLVKTAPHLGQYIRVLRLANEPATDAPGRGVATSIVGLA